MTDTTTQTFDRSAIVDAYLTAYGEPDPARRHALIREAFAPGSELVDPPLTAAGHEEIDSAAAALQQQFAGFRFRRTSEIDAHHDVARYTWELVGETGDRALTGTDVVTFADDGRLARVTGFFGEPTAIAGEHAG